MSPSHLVTSENGLSAAEVAERVSRGLVNRPPRSDWADYRSIVARNLFTLFNALVVPAAVALFLLGEYRGAWAVSGMAVVNTVLGLAQELRAKRHLDRLAILGETRARVVRDGKVHVLPAGEAVQDDHVLLGPGDQVVADGPVVTAHYLEIDEALLTGESDPVPRHRGERLLSGSVCVAGEGSYRAERVGGAAFANQTAQQARRYVFVASPVQRSINRLIRILTGTAVGLCGLYAVLYFVRGFPPEELWQMVAATVTAMVPQGLVLMTTLAFTLGALRMSARGAVVQRLDAVESMASVDVLCMDKTGTLTSNRLTLDRLCVLDRAAAEQEVRGRLRLFAWSSVDAGSRTIQALKAGLGPLPAGPSVEVVDQLPFKSQNRYSAVRLRTADGERLLVLGACEALRPFLAEGDAGWEVAWRELLPTGLRLLLFAEATDSSGSTLQGQLQGLLLRPLALVALSDALRPEAGAVLEALAAQGIRFKILSGDNPETVRATVRHLPLPLAREPVLAGDELDAAPDRAALIESRSVFGRVTPQQKVEIVTTLRQRGHHVGMIGDGVNDVLPIKRADLGIAMGEGSAASRTVAGLVLENNNFELLPAALDEGRTIVRNLRSAAMLFLLKNVYTLFLILAAPGLLGLIFPYLPQHVTLLDVLTIGVPTLLITLSREPSPEPSGPGFLRRIAWVVLSVGLVLGAAGLVVLVLSAWVLHDPPQTQRTLLLSVLVCLGLVALLLVLARPERRRLHSDRWLRLSAGPALLIYGAVMYCPWTAYFFALTPLTLARWGLVLGVAAPASLLCVLLGWGRGKSCRGQGGR